MVTKQRTSRERRNAAQKAKRKGSRETMADARARYLHGHPEWPMVAFQALTSLVKQRRRLSMLLMRMASPVSMLRSIEVEARRLLAADHVTAIDQLWNKLCAEQNGKKTTREERLSRRNRLLKQLGIEQPDKQEAIYQRLMTDFVRAVFAADDNWFDSQANAIRFNDTRSESEKARAQFEVGVLWERENLPAGATAQDILDRLEKRDEPRYGIKTPGAGKRYGTVDRQKKTEGLIVEGCRFSSARRCREAIRRICRANDSPLSG